MKSTLILIISLALLFNACSGGSGDAPTFNSPYLGGNDGLDIKFLEGEPPNEILDQGEESFTVSIEVTNLGEDEILEDEAVFVLKGFTSSDLGVSPSDLVSGPGDIIEARRKNPETGYAIESPSVFVTFEDLKFLPDLAGTTSRTFHVEACYVYDTYATANLCIKENLRDTSDDSVCTISGSKEVANSGAPVQIVSFEEYGHGEDSIRFTFRIAHQNTFGDVYQWGTNCLDIPQNEERVEVRVRVPSFPDSSLSCSGLIDSRSEADWSVVGTKSIQGGGQDVHCTLEVPEDMKTDAVVGAEIMVSYDFAQSISKEVTIKSYE